VPFRLRGSRQTADAWDAEQREVEAMESPKLSHNEIPTPLAAALSGGRSETLSRWPS
jgi:hypothetical protein